MSAKPRILIVRTSALGDVVHCLPVLAALRAELPAARVGWVIEEAMAPLLAGHPDLDELLVVRLRAWRKRPLAAATLREVGRLVTALGDFSADVVLDLMGNHKAGVLAALTLADRRLGLAHGDRREPSSAAWISEPQPARGAHAVERALSVLDGLGLPRREPSFAPERLLAAHAAHVGTAGASEAPESPGLGALLIHPGAGWGNKRYPPERWGEVAALVGERLGQPLGVLAGPGEEQLAERLLAASGGWAKRAAAPTLPALVRVLAGARLLLAGDTGPLHLAHALGAPVLCVMGPTDPAASGPYGAPERALWRQLPCSFCGKRFAETKVCLLDLAPAEIAERALAIDAAATRGAAG